MLVHWPFLIKLTFFSFFQQYSNHCLKIGPFKGHHSDTEKKSQLTEFCFIAITHMSEPNSQSITLVFQFKSNTSIEIYFEQIEILKKKNLTIFAKRVIHIREKQNTSPMV